MKENVQSKKVEMTTLGTTRLCSKVKVKHSSHNVSHKPFIAKITDFHLESTVAVSPYRSFDINLCDILISKQQSFDKDY